MFLRYLIGRWRGGGGSARHPDSMRSISWRRARRRRLQSGSRNETSTTRRRCAAVRAGRSRNEHYATAVCCGTRRPQVDAERVIAFDSVAAMPPAVVGDEERLPFAAGALDFYASVLTLHAVNDVPGALAQIRRALKPNAPFAAAMFGGETLK